MDSFSSFYRDNSGKVFAYLMRMSGDTSLSNDILQECFTRYLEKYGESDLKPALIFRIARNSFLDHVRKGSRGTSLQSDPASSAKDQETLVIIKEKYRHVMSAMLRLPEKERDILSLVVSSDLPYSEIAHIIGISESNVKVSVHRARKHLLKIVGEKLK